MSTRPLRNLVNITPAQTNAQRLAQWQRWERRKHLLARLAQLQTPPSLDFRWQEGPDQQHPMAVPIEGLRWELWQQQSGRCAYCCGSLLPRYHLDHIHPKAKGGQNHPSNYCLACQRCNASKHAKSAMDFVLSLLSHP